MHFHQQPYANEIPSCVSPLRVKRNCNLFISGFYHSHQTSIATPSAEAKADDDDDGADEIVNYK